jgi:hypothetical protein
MVQRDVPASSLEAVSVIDDPAVAVMALDPVRSRLLSDWLSPHRRPHSRRDSSPAPLGTVWSAGNAQSRQGGASEKFGTQKDGKCGRAT